MLPDTWEIADEMYYFESDPRSVGAVFLLSVGGLKKSDPELRQSDQGQPYPVAWYLEKGPGIQSGGVPGRSFYTSLGHLNETWGDELFLSHVFGGITWTLCSGTTRSSNPKATLGQSDNKTDVIFSSTDSNSSTSKGNNHSGLTIGLNILGWCAFLAVIFWCILSIARRPSQAYFPSTQWREPEIASPMT